MNALNHSMPLVQEHFVPLLKLGSCLFVSIPNQLSDSAARDLHESIAHRVAAERTVKGLVLDVSALAIVDSFVAKVLADIASSARTFGVRSVLVGMRPTVVITLVDLGIDLRSIETALTLELALKKLKLRIVSEE